MHCKSVGGRDPGLVVNLPSWPVLSLSWLKCVEEKKFYENSSKTSLDRTTVFMCLVDFSLAPALDSYTSQVWSQTTRPGRNFKHREVMKLLRVSLVS